MDKEWTTVPIRKTTHKIVKKLIEGKGLTWDDVVLSYSKKTKDTIKQVLLNMSNEKFYHLSELAKVLHQMKLINNPTIEDAMQLAEDNLIKGMEKSLQSTATPQIGQVKRA